MKIYGIKKLFWYNWSALYSYEEDSNEIYLFATHDKELKELFIKTNDLNLNVFFEVYGKLKGTKIIEIYQKICLRRAQPEVDKKNLGFMILKETQKLKEIIRKLFRNNN